MRTHTKNYALFLTADRNDKNLCTKLDLNRLRMWFKGASGKDPLSAASLMDTLSLVCLKNLFSVSG